MHIEHIQAQNILLTLGVILVATYNLTQLYNRKQLLTMFGGLHLNVIFFIGIGPFCYALEEVKGERVPYQKVLETSVGPLSYFLLGYFIWSFLQRRINSRNIDLLPDDKGIDVNNSNVVFIFATLAFTGYFLGSLSFARSGIGTIFPVLQNFFYPVIILAILLYKPGQLSSLIMLGLILGIGLITSVFAAWRSQLILVILSIVIGVLFKERKKLFQLTIAAIVLAYLLLPFQQLKKSNYELASQNIWATFWKSQEISINNRSDMIVNFFAIRINGLRELAYIQLGIDNKLIEPRWGMTYWEALQQLIPRFLWPNKPSFNQLTGFYLPRLIGLLSWGDLSTSWSVNLWAEAVWNFGYPLLAVIVSLFFYATYRINYLIPNSMHHQTSKWITQTVLFFIAFQLVSIITTMTHLLWIFIVVRLIDRVILTPIRSPSVSITKNNQQNILSTNFKQVVEN